MSICVWFCVALSLILSFPVIADDDRDYPKEPLDSSQVVPMDKLIAEIKSKFDGSILKVELKTKEHSTGWRYKVKILSEKGRVMKLEYDAETLELLKMKGEEHDDDKSDGFWKKLLD